MVGGGPAGAVMAWSLARRGIDVVVLDQARFPREKVCGDFVEPRGLRLFQAMGCLDALEADDPLAITHVDLYLDGRSAYRDRIPFYADPDGLPRHGYIIPREILDERVLSRRRWPRAPSCARGAESRAWCGGRAGWRCATPMGGSGASGPRWWSGRTVRTPWSPGRSTGWRTTRGTWRCPSGRTWRVWS